MGEFQHEAIRQNQNIPAMITVLDASSIHKTISDNLFIPAHWHRSLEISLIEHAQVALQIGEQEQIIEDDFTCINSGTVHSLRCTKIKEDPCCIILIISYEFLKQVIPNFDSIQFDLRKNLDHRPLKQLYHKLKNAYLDSAPYASFTIQACIFELLALLMKDYQITKEEQFQQALGNQSQIQTILTYLHEHYDEALSLQAMANQFHMSQEHFSRQFHHYVGKTYRDYLTSYRLYKAYEDVIHSDRTIQDIARVHGFLNVRSFIQAFTKLYHETPYQYRKHIK